MTETNEIVDKFVKRRQETVKGLESLAPSALGHAIVELLERGEEPNRATLIAIIKEKIEQTQSARGKIAINMDLARSPLEAALEMLQPHELTEPEQPK